MQITQKQAAAAILAGIVIIVTLGLIIHRAGKPAAPGAPSQPDRISAAMGKIKEANAGLPDPQVQAKMLMMTAFVQRAIPPATNWCDALNAGGQVWPVTPTNTVFALNSQVAGQRFTRGMHGDTVVFFETSVPGWNQAGGSELLASKAEGLAVALLDGRALVVSHDEAIKLRWTP